MTTPNHTPEPWIVNHTSHPSQSLLIRGLDESARWNRSTQLPAPDAERIAACVNALAGLNPSAVKGVVEALRELIQSAERTLELMPGFLNECGVTEEDEEWIPILRFRVGVARSALATIETKGEA